MTQIRKGHRQQRQLAPVIGSREVQAKLREKLHPSRFSAVSRKMAAIVGYVINEHFVDPPICEMTVTGDRFVLARVGNAIGFDLFVGSYADLLQNWKRLLETADLTRDEHIEAECRFAERVGLYGRTIA
jgi:hypothetical protein